MHWLKKLAQRLSHKLFFRPEHKIDGAELLQAIDRASNHLRNILDDPAIKLVWVKRKQDQAFRDFKKQWKPKNSFRWRAKFIPPTPVNLNFTLALYKGDQLSGFCEIDAIFNAQKTQLEIDTIEGNPHQHPLKGYVIAAFSDALTKIAQDLDFQEVSVFGALAKTVPTYLRLGFQERGFELVRSPHTDIAWSDTIAYQKMKGRSFQ
jgi:hypothetical protein